ncbi:MAG: glycosyltransferase family 39 protein, partial [Gemmatimonadota bacterium]
MSKLADSQAPHAATGPERWLERTGAWILVPLVVAYLSLVVPSTLPQGINWDERVDLTIAESYLDGPDGFITGSTDDLTQTRLPMYSVALLALATGSLTLGLARMVSVAVGVLTLLGVYVFCRICLDRSKAAVATAIVATSPYFLAFAGLAFTEGDVFIACATVWVLVAGSWFLRKRTAGAAALTGGALGLAVSSKFFGVALIPAVLAVLWTSRPGQAPHRNGDPRPAAGGVFMLGVAAPLMAWRAVLSGNLASGVAHDLVRLGLVTALMAAFTVWVWPLRRESVSRTVASFIVVTGSVLTFLLVPLVHTTNGRIIGRLLSTTSGSGISGPQVAEFAAFHAGVLLLKPGLLIGLGLLAGSVMALLDLHGRSELRLPSAMAAAYFGFASLTPVAQTFYMMPVFPLLAILMADWLVEVGRRRRRLSVALLAGCVLSVGWDLTATYPNFALNGYQWTDARYLAGRATLGYRGIAQIRTDGIDEVLRWASQNIPGGDTVVGFIEGPHLVRSLEPDPKYRYVNGLVAGPGRDCRDLSCGDW